MESNTKPSKNPKPGTNESPTSKLQSQFLYKALIIALILLIIPLFPSQAPEFVNQTVSTRSWELLHLLFVGIAVSYGLFSTRTEETAGERGSPVSGFDNAQSYVSKLLQVSSVFDDDGELGFVGSDVNHNNDSKVQMWSNRYSRGEPVVVVANENSVVDEHRGVTDRIGEKRLFLPVRSLKCVELGSSDGDGGRVDVSRSVSRSDSSLGSKRGLRESKASDFDELQVQGNGVLPSPIPWRSRSGRMEYNEEVPQSAKPVKPNNSMSFTQSSDLQAKRVEDIARKNSSIHKSYAAAAPPAPPPPPPPPPTMSGKPPLGKSSSSTRFINKNVMYPDREMRRRASSEAINGSEDMSMRRPSFSTATPEAKPRTRIVDTTATGKSVRTTRLNDSFGVLKKPQDILEDINEAEASTFKNAGKMTVGSPIKNDFMDEVLVETDDSESEGEDVSDEYLGNAGEHKAGGVDGSGPDVDKKADEFIAKFREQIRLQRIASIKRSSNGQTNSTTRSPPR